MATYVVKWEIELDAESPEHAAELAACWLVDGESRRPVFEIHEESTPGLTWTVDTEKLFA